MLLFAKSRQGYYFGGARTKGYYGRLRIGHLWRRFATLSIDGIPFNPMYCLNSILLNLP
jgi:hypothetical protein